METTATTPAETGHPDSSYYRELLAVIYADIPDGMNELPDPRALVAQWKKDWDEHRAVIAALTKMYETASNALAAMEDAARKKSVEDRAAARQHPAVAMLQRIQAHCQAIGLDRLPEEDVAEMAIRHLTPKEGA